MSDTQTWYIVKYNTANCKIVPRQEVEDDSVNIIEQWGPFSSREEAIARRVGLIRAGKCEPQ